MLILGIESSCDETAAAVVGDGRLVHSNVISSQIGLHQKTGGVVPEIAARQHVLHIIPVIDEALKQADLNMKEIDAIAVTREPGLTGCLLVGRNTAETLAYIYEKQLIYVNHIHGHVYANYLEAKGDFEFPIVILSVSGGHNDLILMRDYGDFEVLGSTLDDAAGEAFDKVARTIGLTYPGGPSIQKTSSLGDPKAFDFPRSMQHSGDYNFSFSGLKTAVLYKCQDIAFDAANPDLQVQADLAASFQEAICEVLITKLYRAVEEYGAREIHLTGGVSANLRLRNILETQNKNGHQLRWPSHISFCTDNAAMIAAAAYFGVKRSEKSISS